ncbi:cell division protein FtsK [Actinopolymorpha sp. B9G3]|uniref:cell division protein FtsK n=1 Tax=Actinopolymorpha sp. B9G3 TaxID=3158970 RepID=UPI0032D91376
MTTHDEHPNRHIGEHNSGGFMNAPDGKPANGPADPATNDAPEDTTNADDHSLNGADDRPVNGGGTVVPLRPNGVRRLDDVPEQRSSKHGGQAGTELVPDDAITGAVLSEEQSKALDRRLGRQVPREVARRMAAGSVQVAKVVKESEHPRKAGKATLRHSLTLVQGLQSWVVRAWDASTLGVYRRQIKAAEAVGNQELLAEWTERKERVTAARHKRLMDLPQLMYGIARTTVGALAALVVLVLVIGVFVQLSGKGAFVDVITGVMDAIRWTITAVAFAWTPFIMALPWLILLAAWREGRRRGQLPIWLQTTADANVDTLIDETTIARALQALRIPQITAYLKDGLPLQYITPCRTDGRGTHAVIRLPAGVPADAIAQRRAALATGLHRLATEVWPSTGAEAGILDLWIADKGALQEGAGPYPLLEDGLVDVFKGVPFGKTLRGDPILAPVIERNTLTGGMPGQGKSSAARAIMAGAALDPTAELRIWVPDTNFDFEAFKPRCSRYVMGAEDERIAQIAEDLRERYAEIQTRGELLVRYETPAVTRELANKDVGLHPVFGLVEEAHVAIGHPVHGKDIAKLLVDIVRLGRKRAIHLIVSTQAPTRDSMPRDVTRNCSNGIAFAVGDHVTNDALLGQGAYKAGHRATELIPGTDRGTAVVKGFNGERSQVAQVYYIDVDRDNDQITPIINRALAAIEARGNVPGNDRVRQLPESRDLLDDLAAVLGDEPVPAADVPALLAKHAPGWMPYRRLNGKTLRQLLASEYGIKVPTTGNRYPVDPVTIRDAQVRRDTTGPDVDDDT